MTHAFPTRRSADLDGPDRVGLAVRPADQAAYGRVILDEEGRIEKIVEFADADSAQRQIDLCNAGIVLGEAQRLFALVERLGSHNAQGEYYLTDIFALAHAEGRPAGVVRSEEHTSELQSPMRISYSVFCLKKNRRQKRPAHN